MSLATQVSDTGSMRIDKHHLFIAATELAKHMGDQAQAEALSVRTAQFELENGKMPPNEQGKQDFFTEKSAEKIENLLPK